MRRATPTVPDGESDMPQDGYGGFSAPDDGTPDIGAPDIGTPDNGTPDGWHAGRWHDGQRLGARRLGARRVGRGAPATDAGPARRGGTVGHHSRGAARHREPLWLCIAAARVAARLPGVGGRAGAASHRADFWRRWRGARCIVPPPSRPIWRRWLDGTGARRCRCPGPGFATPTVLRRPLPATGRGCSRMPIPGFLAILAAAG